MPNSHGVSGESSDKTLLLLQAREASLRDVAGGWIAHAHQHQQVSLLLLRCQWRPGGEPGLLLPPGSIPLPRPSWSRVRGSQLNQRFGVSWYERGSALFLILCINRVAAFFVCTPWCFSECRFLHLRVWDIRGKKQTQRTPPCYLFSSKLPRQPAFAFPLTES